MAQYNKDLQQTEAIAYEPRYEIVMLADKYGHLLSDNSSTGSDAFGRQRISSPFTLFDSQHRYSLNGKWSSYTSGAGAAVAHQANESTVNLTVGGNANEIVIRETKNVFIYQPGKSLLNLNTFVFNSQKTNLRQRVGYFGDKNGVYFENDGTGNYLVLRSYVTGSVQETRIAQSAWNVDKFDGTGVSKRNLDITKSNIIFADIEWLGVGDVRVGFVVDGRFSIAHIFHNDNVKTTTYMTTACLPIRYEIENTAATGTSSTMKQICSSVVSEGGYDLHGTSYSITNGVPDYQTLSATAGVFTPSISIRLNSSYLDQIAALSEVGVLMQSNTNMQYKITLNATLTNATTWTNSPSGRVQYNTDATALSSGTELLSGFLASGQTLNLNSFTIQLGRTVNDTARSITGTSDILTLSIASFGQNSKVASLLGWSELI